MREGGCLEASPTYQEKPICLEMFMDYACLERHPYLVGGINLETITVLEEQDALAMPASSRTSESVGDVEIPTGCLSSNPAVPDDEKN